MEQIKFRECLPSFGSKYFVSKPPFSNIKFKLHKTTISPVFICVWKAVSNPKDKHRSRVPRIRKPNRNEVSEPWVNLHTEKINNLHFSSDIVRMIKSGRIRRVRHTARTDKTAHKMLVRRPLGKILLGRRKPIWKDNIKMALQNRRGREWTKFIWLRIEHSNETSMSHKRQNIWMNTWATISLSRTLLHGVSQLLWTKLTIKHGCW